MLIRTMQIVLCMNLLLSCQGCMDMRFEQQRWQLREDIEYPYRNRMLSDLIGNYRLKGCKHDELIQRLGMPDFSESNSITYKIVEDYGTDIDPVYTKNLVLDFNRDSIVTGIRVEEWHK